MKVKELLDKKGRAVITIGQNETIEAAIQKLVGNSIGALPVCDTKDKILGIVSERDLLKECSKSSKKIDSTRVKDVMTRDVAIGLPEDELDYVRSIMTQKRIRHLPIMAGARLEGIISMRDIIETQLEESRAQVRFFNDYVSGGYV
ncbi:MAG: CBS domain-containing protein [Dehalococcoidales bacterium]|nr:CBS domain-containing protein [Dehalococcoidales bacterium]MDZ4230644.1 CBS domain-containing protein [Dehalococcoidales bacterium]